MAIESKSLLVAVKAFSRANPLPIDTSAVWGTKGEADTYAKQPNAYAGQVITAKVNGEYKAFILQGENGNCTLAPVGADPSTLKEYVQIGTRPDSKQEQGVIYIDGNVGYIWTGDAWQKVFEDVSASITDYGTRIGKLESDMAPKLNPEFSGTMKLNGKEIATKEYADAIVAAAKSEVPIVIDADHPFPADSYKAGQKYVVAQAGTYLGQKCEVGDLILIVKDYAKGSAADSDGIVLQANIDGAVTGADSSIDGEIVVFSGVTGKVIKSSKINMTALSEALSKAHEHANKDKLDSFTKSQEELLAEINQSIQDKIKSKADQSTTLAGYGIEDAYTKSDIDAKVKVIEDNVNSKVDSATVDTKITEAKSGFLQEAATQASTALEERIGGIDKGTTLKSYIDTAVGAGGSSSAEAILQAKNEAIAESKKYTDAALTIVEF